MPADDTPLGATVTGSGAGDAGDGDGPGEARVRHGSTRWTPRWILLLAGVLLLARIATGIYENRNPPTRVDQVEWRPIEQAADASRGSHKPILYDFTAEWCPPCQAMSREVFSDEKQASMIVGMFVPVRVLDRAREEGANLPEVEALQQRYRIEAFPTLIVASADGNELGRVEGYPGKDGLMKELRNAWFRAQAPHSGVGDTLVPLLPR
jgi:thiol:disulfide interchange protein